MYNLIHHAVVLEGVAAIATFLSSILWIVSFVIHAGIFPQSIEAVKAKGTALVDSLFTYSDLWHSRRSSAQQRLLTAPGDALVTAAAVCYLGPLVPAAREHLFSDWLQVCDGTSRDTKERLLSLSSMVLDDARNKTSVDDNCAGNKNGPTVEWINLPSKSIILWPCKTHLRRKHESKAWGPHRSLIV